MDKAQVKRVDGKKWRGIFVATFKSLKRGAAQVYEGISFVVGRTVSSLGRTVARKVAKRKKKPQKGRGPDGKFVIRG